MDDSGLPPSLKKRSQPRIPSSSWVGSVVERLRSALYAPEPEEELSGEEEPEEIVRDSSFNLLNDIVEQNASRSALASSSNNESFKLALPGTWPTPRVNRAGDNPTSHHALTTPSTAPVAQTESTPLRPLFNRDSAQDTSDLGDSSTQGNRITTQDTSVLDASFVTAPEGHQTVDVSQPSENEHTSFMTATEGERTIQPLAKSESDLGQDSEIQFYDGSTLGPDDLHDSPKEIDDSLLAASEDIDMEDEVEDISIEDFDELEAELLTNDEFEVEELDEDDISEASDLEPQVTEPEDIDEEDVDEEDIDESEIYESQSEVESQDLDSRQSASSDDDASIDVAEDDAEVEVVDLVDDSPEYEYINNEEYVAADHEETTEPQYEQWNNYSSQELANIFTAIENADTAGFEAPQPEFSVEPGLEPVPIPTEAAHDAQPSEMAQERDLMETARPLELATHSTEVLHPVETDLWDQSVPEPAESSSTDHFVSQSAEPEESRVGFDITIGTDEEPADVIDTLPEAETPEPVEPAEPAEPTETPKKPQVDPFDSGDYGLWNLFQVGFTVAPGEGNEKPLPLPSTIHKPLEEKVLLRSMADEALFLCSRSSLFGGASTPSRAPSHVPEQPTAIAPQSTPRRDLSKRALELLLKAPLFGGTAPVTKKPKTPEVKKPESPEAKKPKIPEVKKPKTPEAKKPLPKPSQDSELKILKTRRHSRRLTKPTEVEPTEAVQAASEEPAPVQAEPMDIEPTEAPMEEAQTPTGRKRRAKTTPKSAKKRARRTSQASPTERRRTLRNGKTLPEPE